MSNVGRRLQKQKQDTAKKWALKEVQRKDALVFGVVNTGSTLGGTLRSNSIQPMAGLVRLPPDVSDGLIEAGNVWVDGVVCKDHDRVMQAGNFIAVYPNERMYLFEDAQGRRALRMKE